MASDFPYDWLLDSFFRGKKGQFKGVDPSINPSGLAVLPLGHMEGAFFLILTLTLSSLIFSLSPLAFSHSIRQEACAARF